MEDSFDELVIDVRANTQEFAAELESVRSAVDVSLIDGIDRAGATIERSLLSALQKGSLGFEDLEKVAVRSLDAIAAQALTIGLDSLVGSPSGGLSGFLGQTFGALLGVPGRATGGDVSPGRAYLVGESGPELFMPTSAGRVESNRALGGRGRDVRVAINLSTPRGTSAPVAMQRSSRQVASAIRQALINN
ncbi:MAG: tail tape measure protein [Pseudomonadota bacterium]